MSDCLPPDVAALGLRFMTIAKLHQPGGQLRDDEGIIWQHSDATDWAAGGDGWPLPDVRDPATVGALLGRVREAWGDPTLFAVILFDGAWHVGSPRTVGQPRRVVCAGSTEAAALLAALEAAP